MYCSVCGVVATYGCTWDVDVRQTEIHTAEPQGPEQSGFGFEMVNGNLNKPKSPAILTNASRILYSRCRSIGSYPLNINSV
jgi:hypothetical protein